MFSNDDHQREPIAIVGIGCRFPDASGAHAYWELLRDGRNVIREVPKERFDIEAVPGLTTRGGGFLDGLLDFDADFFRMSPREAEALDPQQRLLLEVSAEALDDAYLSREALAQHRTGVYVGCWGSDWEAHAYAQRSRNDIYSMNGAIRCMLSGRISFAFDLRGPSLTIDTGCSASLLAVHLACQSLWLGESALALAGGVNLVLDPKHGLTFSHSGMLARDSQCKSFDARADGFVRSDGCGVVVLMPLSAAIARGARIYAAIRGSGASNDGFSNGLLATPSEAGQELAIQTAYRSAGLTPRDVQYIEAHGTGTRAGDPVELRALTAAMGERCASEPCWIGSVKGNIGHTEAAAGIAGLIKAALALRQRTIPQTLHAGAPTPAFDWQTSPLQLVAATMPWPDVEVARAAVSSFGMSGTNVHMLLEEAPRTTSDAIQPPARDELLMLSAATEPALIATARAMCERLREPVALHDLCYSAATGRHHHSQRLCAVGSTREELHESLTAWLRGETHPAIVTDSPRSSELGPVFVFSGQASQCTGMARELIEQEPVFRGAITACDRALSKHVTYSLVEKLSADTDWAREPIDVIQPALFAIQVALARCLFELGIRPAMIVGHSMGEVAAAHVAGVLTLEDAALIIAKRSQNLQALAGRGGMLSVELGFAEAENLIANVREHVAIAASNSPRASVLAGDRATLAQLAHALSERGVFAREIAVDAAAHSPQLDPLLPEFAHALRDVRPLDSAHTPLCSTVSASVLPPSAFTAEYWVQNQREPVRFSAAMLELARLGYRTFVELSPQPILLGAIQQHASQARVIGLQRRGEPQRRCWLQGLGRLHALGAPLQLGALFSEAARFVELPRYPFQRERLGSWPLARDAAAHGLGAPVRSPLDPNTYLWQVSLGQDELARLCEHRVSGESVLPGTVYADLALLALQRSVGATWALEALQFARALVLAGDQPSSLQIALQFEAPDAVKISFYSQAIDPHPATLHATLRAMRLAELPARPATLAPTTAADGCEAWAPDAYLDESLQRELSFGPQLRTLAGLWLGPAEALAELVATTPAREHALDPVALIGGWQAAFAWVYANTPARAVYMPTGVERIDVFGPTARARWARARVRPAADMAQVVADVTLYDEQGRALVETRGLSLRGVDPGAAVLDEALYHPRWDACARSSRRRDLTGQTWLVLADRERGVARRVAAALEARGARCVVSQAGHAELANVLRECGPLAGLVDLWPLDTDPHACGELELRRAQALGAIGLTHIVQALSAAGIESCELWIATAGAQAVVAGDLPLMAAAPVWAVARVLRCELPKLSIHALDLSADASERELRGMLEELGDPEADDQIALRGEARYVLQLARPSLAPPRDDTPMCREDATYLITGGLGGLGLQVARFLVRQGARHLVLLGRSAPSPDAARVVSELREQGATVATLRCDISRAGQLSDVLGHVRAHMPPLRGVIHSAVVLDDGVALQLTPERFDRVMAPKMLGAQHLHDQTLDLPLDFFVLFSSAASVLGPPAQGNYAAGNEYMDALAHRRRAQGLPALSINWGPWRESGLAARPDLEGRLAIRGIGSLSDAEGLALLERLMRSDAIQCAVLPRARFRAWEEWYPRAARSMLQTLLRDERAAAAPHTSVPRSGGRRSELAAAPRAARAALLETYLSALIRQVLRIPASKALATDQPLHRYGLDSLMAVELKNRIEIDLTVSLPVSKLLLSTGICKLGDELLALFDFDSESDDGDLGAEPEWLDLDEDECAPADSAAE